jgi:hypothetical protein
MNRTVDPGKPDTAMTDTTSDQLSVVSRIQLAFLDEYSCEKKGYDPYDTSKDRRPDVWAAKRKRA